jgi:hypothetical protein
MRTFDFFADINDFKEVVPGIESSTTFKSMMASHERSRQKLIHVLTAAIYTQLKDAFGAAAPGETLDTAVEFIQGAHGNLIAYFDLIPKIIAQKAENKNYYKYEIQMMQETYLDNYVVNMDLLLDHLDANTTFFATWAATDTYKNRQKLMLKTANDFNSVFPTGGSAYFFSLITPLQNQVIETELAPRKAVADIPEALVKTAKYFVAYRTIAKAVRITDYADLPRSLRQKLYVEESKKKMLDSETSVEKFAKYCDTEANRYLNQIDLELQKPADDVSEISVPPDDFNLETDSTYVIV